MKNKTPVAQDQSKDSGTPPALADKESTRQALLRSYGECINREALTKLFEQLYPQRWKDDQEWIDKEEAPENLKGWEDRAIGQSLLDFLEQEACILEIVGVTTDKRQIVIGEACDRCFRLTFDKSQLGELIGELKEIHDHMKE